VGQGAIGIESRRDDPEVNALLQALHDPGTALCVSAERAFNHRLNGGCQAPIAGHAELKGDRLHLRGLVASPEGQPAVRGEVEGRPGEAVQLGIRLAEQLLASGADRILHEIFAAA
jgi:hydroxymethylbilane synthase